MISVKYRITHKVDQMDYIMLPCSNEYLMIVLYDNPFDIIGVIYNAADLCEHILAHVKSNRRYYATVSNNYLNRKKLDLVNWLSSMLTRKLPADELCLHATATYLNIHITVDYLGGFWTTLDIPHIHHDLAPILSDIHLVYHGSCRYNLLCKNTTLKTIGRKLMIHKDRHKLPEATLVLHRVEEWNPMAMRLINEDLAESNLTSQYENTDLDSTEIYEIHKNKQELPEVLLVLQRVEECNPTAMRLINKLHLSSQNENIDSDSTEIYEIHENVIGTIYYLPDDTMTRTSPKSQREIKATSSPYFSFKCPFSKCKYKAKRQKEISDHYRTMHKKLSRCKISGKSYTTPHSLKQYLYKHANVKKNYMCKSCGISYPFHSQL